MSNYIPTYQKKLRIRNKREADLRRLISKDAARIQLLEAAIALRDARVRALKAQRAALSPLASTQAIDSQLQLAVAATPENVLAEFQPAVRS